MRDTICIHPDGRRMPVADMTTEDIHASLRDGFDAFGGTTENNIRDRLEIEVLIRNLGLREKI